MSFLSFGNFEWSGAFGTPFRVDPKEIIVAIIDGPLGQHAFDCCF